MTVNHLRSNVSLQSLKDCQRSDGTVGLFFDKKTGMFSINQGEGLLKVAEGTPLIVHCIYVDKKVVLANDREEYRLLTKPSL